MAVALDTTLGALLIGTWVNAMLYMLQIMQTCKFFTVFSNEHKVIKAVVAGALFADTLGTMNVCACVYLYCISHWGDWNYILNQNWSVPAYVILSGISACITQLFLTWRFWILTRNRFVSFVLVALTATALAGALVNAATVVAYSAYSQRDHNIKTVTLWLVASVAADIAIAAALVWRLKSMDSPFPSTQSLIHQLIVTSISTGSATSLLAVVCLILYLIDTHINITVGFGFCLGRLYSLTMLFNLNTRPKGFVGLDCTTSGSGTAGVGEFQVQNGLTRDTDFTGINFHHSSLIHVDEVATLNSRSHRL